jgi:flavin-dependent dehydrogenase
MNPTPTISLREAAEACWDVLVIGAGPAGALAAREVAGHRMATLLVEAKKFPRPKVCGGCLNRRAIALLTRVGLSRVLNVCRAAPTGELHLTAGGRSVRLPLPMGWAIARDVFDAVLVMEAVRAGVSFLDGAQATVEPVLETDMRRVTVNRGMERATICARVVISADGLSRTSTRLLPEFTTYVAPNSRIGIGATFPANVFACPPGQITMAVSRAGYVGLANCGENRLNVAAAFDPAALARRSAGEVVFELLRDADFDVPAAFPATAWHGTWPLTSRPSRAAADRLFLIGDACGYVEPFSGEGMAAAMESALAVAPMASAGARAWQPSFLDRWTTIHGRLVYDQQATCRRLAWMLRRPWATTMAMGVSRLWPAAARRVIAKVS